MDAKNLDLCRALESIPSGLIVIDAEGIIRYINQTAGRILTLPMDLAETRPIQEASPPIAGKMLESLRTGAHLHGEKVETGGLTLTANITPIRKNGEIWGAVGVFQEISGAETPSHELTAVKDLKIWLDAIIDSSFDGLWICDREGKVIRINKASEKILGVPAERVIGKNMSELVAEGLIDKSVTLEVLKKKTSVTMMQELKGGKTVFVTGNPIFDEKGDIAFVVTNDRDFTVLDHLRRQLQETQALAKGYFSRLSELEMKGVDRSVVIFKSKVMQRIIKMALRVAGVDSTVLLLGESGVGKGMVAKLIHKNSERNQGPFIHVDCAGIPESLIESELFGYERGAFTGAKSEGKPGFFELANGGTLFLDEIGEIPLKSQPKLLHFLEDHEITRVGGIRAKQIDVRIIAATNKNIEEMVATKSFRDDLYYRLNVIPIYIPPLRERKDDILTLIIHFVEKFNRAWQKQRVLSPEAMETLIEYSFPGNIRELANLIERVVVISEADRIEMKDLPSTLTGGEKRSPNSPASEELPLNVALENYERVIIEEAMRKFGSQREVAKALRVDQATISRKMKKYSYAILHRQ